LYIIVDIPVTNIGITHETTKKTTDFFVCHAGYPSHCEWSDFCLRHPSGRRHDNRNGIVVVLKYFTIISVFRRNTSTSENRFSHHADGMKPRKKRHDNKPKAANNAPNRPNGLPKRSFRSAK
jgi:hypothetical protein